MNIIILLIFIISIAYLLVISMYNIGWFILPNYIRTGKTYTTKISIIIAARNEENTIINCLKDITGQDYPSDLVEIIVVDDNSEDNTSDAINHFIIYNNQNIKLIINDNLRLNTGKKAALETGINESKGELIITTDADCRMGNRWLSTIVDYYEKYKPKMIIGPVSFVNENSLFKRLQSLEFLSLIGVTAGSASLKSPLMCNGANLTFEKQAFIETGGYNNNATFASGDDMFLMESIHKRYKNGVKFLKNKEAIVYTEPKNNLQELMNQRKRWVSKAKGYKSLRIIGVAIVVYLFNLSLLGLLIGSVINNKLMFVFISLLIIKILIDMPILSGIARFVEKSYLLRYLIPLEIINVFYVSIIGIAGTLLPYTWKKRVIIK